MPRKGRREHAGRRTARARSSSTGTEEPDSSPVRGKQAKKRRKKMVSESESSESETSSGGQSGAGKDSSSSGDVSEDKRRKKRKKHGARRVHWELVNAMWALEDRPRHLQDKKVVAGMSITEITQFKEHFEREELRKGGGSALFGKDSVLKARKFKAGADDGREKLHEARFDLRMPFSLPKSYWSRIPAKRDLFRHFPLSHLGMEGQVSEATVLRMHDRRVPVSLGMLYKANATRDSKAQEQQAWVEPTEVRHLQEAVLNYTVVLQALWPLDYAGLVMTRVLVEAKWGEVVGENEKDRVVLVKKFFDDVVKDNSGRAVRDEPPLDYEEAKTRWVRTLESLYPNLTLVGVASSLSALGKGHQQQQGHGGGQGRGGASTKGRGGQVGRGGRGGGLRQAPTERGLPSMACRCALAITGRLDALGTALSRMSARMVTGTTTPMPATTLTSRRQLSAYRCTLGTRITEWSTEC